MSNRHPEGADAPIAKRARQLRRAIMGDHQGSSAAFAAKIGVTPQRWSNVERGIPLSRQVSERITLAIPGFNDGWLRYGNPSGLSVDLWQKLEAASERDENASTGR